MDVSADWLLSLHNRSPLVPDLINPISGTTNTNTSSLQRQTLVPLLERSAQGLVAMPVFRRFVLCEGWRLAYHVAKRAEFCERRSGARGLWFCPSSARAINGMHTSSSTVH